MEASSASFSERHPELPILVAVAELTAARAEQGLPPDQSAAGERIHVGDEPRVEFAVRHLPHWLLAELNVAPGSAGRRVGIERIR